MAIHYGAVDGTYYPVKETFIQTNPTTIKIDHGSKYGKEIVTVPGKKIYTQKGVNVGAQKGHFRTKLERGISSEIIEERPIKNAVEINNKVTAIKLNDGVEFNKKTKRKKK